MNEKLIYLGNDGRYHYREKVLTDRLEIGYRESEEGFEEEEDAVVAYANHLGAFKERISLIRQNGPATENGLFSDYLLRWYHNTYIPRSDSSA